MTFLSLKHFGLILCLLSCFANAESTKIAILPTNDYSSYNLGDSLQKSLENLFKETGAFQPVLTSEVLQEFTPQEASRVMRFSETNALAFGFLEPKRVSVFIFDKERSTQYIAASRILSELQASTLKKPYIDNEVKLAFKDALQLRKDGKYQELPNSKPIAQVVPQFEAPKEKSIHRTFRYHAGLGLLVSGATEYSINSPSITQKYSNSKALQIRLGLTTMFNSFLGFDLSLNFGRLYVQDAEGFDSVFSLLVGPQIQIPLSKKFRLLINGGLSLNRVSVLSWTDDGTVSIFPETEPRFILGFHQGVGFQYLLGEKNFLELSGIHQAFKLTNVSADVFASGSSASIDGNINYDFWSAFLSFGVYF